MTTISPEVEREPLQEWHEFDAEEWEYADDDFDDDGDDEEEGNALED